MMIRRQNLFVLIVTSGLALPAWSGCNLPPAPTKVPDGNTATKEEMIAAMETLKRYDTDVNNYTKCLEFEAKQKRMLSDEQTRKHNAAVDGLQAIAAKFNKQVRVFNARNS